jgi:hypothetical protein
VAGLEKMTGEMTAGETGRARDENSHAWGAGCTRLTAISRSHTCFVRAT